MSDDSSVITEQCILRAEIIVSEDRKKGQKRENTGCFSVSQMLQRKNVIMKCSDASHPVLDYFRFVSEFQN